MTLDELAKDLHDKLMRDRVLRQGSPVETIKGYFKQAINAHVEAIKGDVEEAQNEWRDDMRDNKEVEGDDHDPNSYGAGFDEGGLAAFADAIRLIDARRIT